MDLSKLRNKKVDLYHMRKKVFGKLQQTDSNVIIGR